MCEYFKKQKLPITALLQSDQQHQEQHQDETRPVGSTNVNLTQCYKEKLDEMSNINLAGVSSWIRIGSLTSELLYLCNTMD